MHDTISKMTMDTDKKTLEFTLEGEVPSKKNAWKPRANGGRYIPEDVQANIDALLWQLKKIRSMLPRPITGPISIRVDITSHTKKQDTDNRYTTLQDILQKADILANDNDVDEIYCRRSVSKNSMPTVHVTIFHAS